MSHPYKVYFGFRGRYHYTPLFFDLQAIFFHLVIFILCNRACPAVAGLSALQRSRAGKQSALGELPSIKSRTRACARICSRAGARVLSRARARVLTRARRLSLRYAALAPCLSPARRQPRRQTPDASAPAWRQLRSALHPESDIILLTNWLTSRCYAAMGWRVSSAVAVITPLRKPRASLRHGVSLVGRRLTPSHRRGACCASFVLRDGWFMYGPGRRRRFATTRARPYLSIYRQRLTPWESLSDIMFPKAGGVPPSFRSARRSRTGLRPARLCAPCRAPIPIFWLCRALTAAALWAFLFRCASGAQPQKGRAPAPFGAPILPPLGWEALSRFPSAVHFVKASGARGPSASAPCGAALTKSTGWGLGGLRQGVSRPAFSRCRRGSPSPLPPSP